MVQRKNSILEAGLGAVLFGIATLKTGNITLSTGLDFAWNSVHWMLGYKDNTGLFVEVASKENGWQGEIASYGLHCSDTIRNSNSFSINQISKR